MYNLLIVEDDPTQLQALKNIVTQYHPELTVYSTSNSVDALNMAEDNPIHLFFLDINLGIDNGIDLAKTLRLNKKYELTPIIFITSLPDMIFQALNETHCYFYIVKPYTVQTVTSLLAKLTCSDILEKKENLVLSIKANGGVRVILKYNDIQYIESNGKFVKIVTHQGTFLSRDYSLKSLQALLASYFIQCHRCYLVNVNHIISFDLTTNLLKLRNCKDYIPIGKKHKISLTERLNGRQI